MKKPMKTKAPAGGAAGALRKHQTQLKFSDESTETEAQRERIVQALRRRPQTSYDLRRMGCYQAPARVKELRDRFGFVIETTRITLVDRDGFSHPRAALYTLVSEPHGERPQ
ncbi:hypothetical protein RA8CHR_05225 [Variovorax sp. RA8]|nr:hypothetical protein RA8CHR_05225 [Variovorax sp. RA8]